MGVFLRMERGEFGDFYAFGPGLRAGYFSRARFCGEDLQVRRMRSGGGKRLEKPGRGVGERK